MNNRTAVVTGSTGGLGGEVVRGLAQDGWDLILLDRTPAKQEKILEGLKAAYPDQHFEGQRIDLMDLPTVHKAIEAVKATTKSINALWNISGLLTDARRDSAQGIEGHFAVNTVAPYALIRGLQPLLAEGAKAAPAYIANFTTGGVNNVKSLDVGALTDPPEVGGLFGAYSISKAALQMVGVALADTLKSQGILTYAVDPGATKTSMTDGNAAMPWFIRLLRPLLFQPVEKQAAKLMSAVKDAAAQQETGLFISGGKRKKHPPLMFDEAAQRELLSLLDGLTAPS
ncbi:MAG: SDR family NAD(P)-dependent oxidoreductase [Bradymonadia bacterium]